MESARALIRLNIWNGNLAKSANFPQIALTRCFPGTPFAIKHVGQHWLRQWFASSLKPSYNLEQCLSIVNWTNTIPFNVFNKNCTFHHEHAVEKHYCKLVTILPASIYSFGVNDNYSLFMSSRLQCLPVENKFLTSSNTKALVVYWSFNDYNYSLYLRLQQ